MYRSVRRGGVSPGRATEILHLTPFIARQCLLARESPTAMKAPQSALSLRRSRVISDGIVFLCLSFFLIGLVEDALANRLRSPGPNARMPRHISRGCHAVDDVSISRSCTKSCSHESSHRPRALPGVSRCISKLMIPTMLRLEQLEINPSTFKLELHLDHFSFLHATS